MWKASFNRKEQKALTFYKSLREARRNCSLVDGETVVRAVDLYSKYSLGYAVMDACEADARRVK